MSPSFHRNLVIAALLLVFVVVNASIYAKERLKTHGETVFLSLAPVDPRSLMQGDYMALRFTLANELPTDRSGSAPLLLDARRVGTLDRGNLPDSLRIRYRIRGQRVWLGTNAYFFEEGTAERYTAARFGEFRVDRDSGEALLVGLRDADLKPM